MTAERSAIGMLQTARQHDEQAQRLRQAAGVLLAKLPPSKPRIERVAHKSGYSRNTVCLLAGYQQYD